ncbi:MAG TPA: PKD domain-containing protein, partial [Segetibacter sp.]
EGCRKPIKGIDSIRAEKLQPGFTWNTTNNCGNSNVGFSDTSRSFFGVQQWQWSFGDGAVGTGKNVQHQYNNAGIYQVRLIITSPLGCKDTITKPVNVVVYNRPSVTIQTNSNGCVSTPHQFTTNVQSADSVSTYSWNMGNGQTQQGKSVTAVYTNAGTYNISLITRTINGCYDTTSTAITVHPAPQLVANKQLQICRGQQIVLRASNATSVTWSNDQQTICSNCTQTTVSPLTTTKYYVSGANQYGCTSRDTVVVNVIQSFNMRISGVDTLCVGEQTQIFSSGATTCTWFPAEGLSKTDVANPFAKPSVTTTYTVIGHDASNCFSDTANVQIVVGAPTQVHLGADTIVIGGSSIVLGSRLTNGIATQYKWSSAAQLNCSNCPEPVATIRRDECFTSTVTNQYGCVTSDTICIKTFCKDAQVFIPNAFSPDADGVNDLFYVMGSGIKVVKSFMIFTRWGELIFQKENFQVNDVSKGWDGTIRGQKAPPDVFVYICNVLCENGVPYSYKGNVAIIK